MQSAGPALTLYRFVGDIGCCCAALVVVRFSKSVLSALQDQDAIDFTDNDLSSLGNFPYFPRLRTLLLARNRIIHIQPNLGSSTPSLTTLVLTSNHLSELADVEALRTLHKLTHLVLLENPITRKEVRTPFLKEVFGSWNDRSPNSLL